MLRAHGSSLAALLVVLSASTAGAQLVPGTGHRVSDLGDDFENTDWKYSLAGTKSSYDDDGRIRFPLGKSNNGMWKEGKKRGHPDYIVRVATPAGGLPGSRGALRLQTRDTGIPGRPTGQMHQDDFLSRTHVLDAEDSPSYVVRVYLPPFEQWENRSGSTFGFRIGCKATTTSMNSAKKKGFLEAVLPSFADEGYWPGMFIQFHSSHDGSRKKDAAVLLCRAGASGREFNGPTMRPGWWTLGISVTADGSVHYYARPGVERLTTEDRIGSSYPYSLKCDRVTHMFFNVCSPDDAKTWSTSWIIDDPTAYVATPGGRRLPAPRTAISPAGMFRIR